MSSCEPCQLAQRLSGRLATAPAAFIMVDGTPVAALKEGGQEVLKASGNSICPRKIQFWKKAMCETVEIVPGGYPREAAMAKPCIQRGTDEVTHLVTRGNPSGA